MSRWMPTILACVPLALAAQQPAADPAGEAPADATQVAPSAAPELPPVEPWDRAFSAGLAEIRSQAEAGVLAGALEISERLVAPNAPLRWIESLAQAGGWRARLGAAVEGVLDPLDLLGPPPAVRAEAHFARAVALQRAAAHEEAGKRAGLRGLAAQSFDRARILAGPGELRAVAAYGRAWTALDAAEELRGKIPEIAGTAGAPPPPAPAPGTPGARGAEPPDPLALARAAYVEAREQFIERLRLDWRDADSQANTELIQRRLRELDAIEKQREEQKQEQQEKEQQEKQDQQDQQDQKQDSSDKPEDGKDDPEPEQPKEQEPGEDQPPEEPKPEEAPQPDEEPEDEEQPRPAPEDEKQMSKEEMTQLLDRLQRIEEIQKELQEKLKRMRRVPVKKDW